MSINHDDERNRNKKENFQKLLSAAEGNWDYILRSLAGDQLADALNKPGKHVPCPVHHDSKDGFRLLRDYGKNGAGACWTCNNGKVLTGFDLLVWLKGYSFTDAVREVAILLGLSYSQNNKVPIQKLPPATRKPQSSKTKEEIIASKQKKANWYTKLWQQAFPGNHANAEVLRRYFASRHLDPTHFPDTIRLHPRMKWMDDQDPSIELGPFPTILSQMCIYKNGTFVPRGLHRTYLDSCGSGKASVPKARKMLPSIDGRGGNRGCIVPLDRPARVMNIAEGLETAWSVRMVTGLPTIYGVATYFLSEAIIPAEVELLLIWQDLDKDKVDGNGKVSNAGRDAAAELYKRFTSIGKKAYIFCPPGEIPEGKKGIDWNDILINQGPAAFPDAFEIQNIIRSYLDFAA